MDYDFAIVGGGLVGASIAYGLGRQGNKVVVLDEGDLAFRASRGNFGLVWVQGKGWDYPAYANWTQQAAALWPLFDEELRDSTGIDLGYACPGGMEFCVNEDEMAELEGCMRQINRHSNGAFEYEMLDHAALKKRVPQISNQIAGASYSPQDGHVNPLYLLRALHHSMDSNHTDYLPNHQVISIEPLDDEFLLHTEGARVNANRVVLCGGLDNERLGNMVGLNIPVRAIRGQLLITERVESFLKFPCLQIRQTQEGTLQIGDSQEEVGLDDRTSVSVITTLAQRAVRIFPMLESVRLIRAWAALRVMTPDGKPVYQQSSLYPGAYGIACHSGVTLAAIHTGPVAQWIAGKAEHELIAQFSSDRFDVP